MFLFPLSIIRNKENWFKVSIAYFCQGLNWTEFFFPIPTYDNLIRIFYFYDNCESITIFKISDQHSKGGGNFLLQHETGEMGVVVFVVIQ